MGDGVSGYTPGPWTVANEGEVFYVPELQGRYTEANARLIAAAPEMAELLGRIADDWFADDFQERIRALLSRVRGEA